jgi:hypothetical protein
MNKNLLISSIILYFCFASMPLSASHNPLASSVTISDMSFGGIYAASGSLNFDATGHIETDDFFGSPLTGDVVVLYDERRFNT